MATDYNSQWMQSPWSSIQFAKMRIVFSVMFAISGCIFICMGLYLFFTFTRTGIAIPGFPLRIPWLLVILGISVLVTLLLASLPTDELLYKFFVSDSTQHIQNQWHYPQPLNGNPKGTTWLFQYSSVLFVYGVVELFTGGYLTQYYDTIKTSFKKNLLKHIDNYLHDDDKLMDSIQYQFQCCGADGPEDWLNSPAKRIPSSCCKVHFCVTTDMSGIHDVGCEFMIMYCLNLRLTLMAIVTILLALLPLCGGFIVLFEAYAKMAGYVEIPTEKPPNADQEIPSKRSIEGPKHR